ncbi:hypothetical protein [Vibrio taketomensis]|uniref:hypothetical protein n=1 Tax=Vibrio taketomensis TaxID=2572923 RepID=UPI001389F7A2|nr:hypothetical protein [Vibrio taketomensis]
MVSFEAVRFTSIQKRTSVLHLRLNIDSGEHNTDSVTVLAVNDIYLAETDGDFLAKKSHQVLVT